MERDLRGQEEQAQERHVDQRYRPRDLLILLAGRNAHSEKNSPPGIQGSTSQMNRYCLLEEECLLKYIANLMSILLLDNLSEQHQTDMRGRKGLKGRKGQKGKKGQRGELSNKGAKMMLVEEEIHKGTGTQMGMTVRRGFAVLPSRPKLPTSKKC